MIIKVTNEHIRKAKHLNNHRARYCPVGRALTDACNTTNVLVGVNSIVINDDDNYYVPRSVTRFVQNFDYGKPVKPFNFRLVKT